MLSAKDGVDTLGLKKLTERVRIEIRNVCVSVFYATCNDISVIYKREKGRDLTQSYDKSPYTNRNVKMSKWQHEQRHKKFDYTAVADRLRTAQMCRRTEEEVVPTVELPTPLTCLWRHCTGPSLRISQKQKRNTEGCSKFKSPETSSGEIGLDIRTWKPIFSHVKFIERTRQIIRQEKSNQ